MDNYILLVIKSPSPLEMQSIREHQSKTLSSEQRVRGEVKQFGNFYENGIARQAERKTEKTVRKVDGPGKDEY